MEPILRTELGENQKKPTPWAFHLALCFLGPLFFLSYVFTLLSPLPLLYLHSGNPRKNEGRLWLGIAILLGAAISFAIKGWGASLGFVVVSGIPALVLGEIMIAKQSPERAVLGAFAAICFSALAAGYGASVAGNFSLVSTTREAVEAQVKLVTQRILDQNQGDLPDQTSEELKNLTEKPSGIYQELPGLTASALLLLCILPCLALIRWNPKGFLRRAAISRDFLRKWKSPEWMVWLALFCGVFLIFDVNYLSTIANNLLKPILLIYFFQGMSILAFFLDSLRLRGPLRVIVYGAGIMFLTPMVVSFGFFDLWFNFRGRRSPPSEEKES